MTKGANDAMPEEQLVLVEDHGNWALMTINRPEKRNAMNEAARQRFRDALEEVHDKRVVVLTGIGPSFCAGVDLVEAADPAATEHVPGGVGGSWAECNEQVRKHPAVFVAAVNGYALGGGSTLVNNCELAVAAESALIGTPEMGFGEWPGLAGPALINRTLPKHAAEIIFMAKRVDALTALRMGIVNEVVSDDKLLARASEIAEHISAFDQTALEWGKKAFQAMVNLSWEESMDLSLETGAAIRTHRAGPVEGFSQSDFADGRRGAGQGR